MAYRMYDAEGKEVPLVRGKIPKKKKPTEPPVYKKILKKVKDTSIDAKYQQEMQKAEIDQSAQDIIQEPMQVKPSPKQTQGAFKKVGNVLQTASKLRDLAAEKQAVDAFETSMTKTERQLSYNLMKTENDLAKGKYVSPFDAPEFKTPTLKEYQQEKLIKDTRRAQEIGMDVKQYREYQNIAQKATQRYGSPIGVQDVDKLALMKPYMDTMESLNPFYKEKSFSERKKSFDNVNAYAYRYKQGYDIVKDYAKVANDLNIRVNAGDISKEEALSVLLYLNILDPNNPTDKDLAANIFKNKDKTTWVPEWETKANKAYGRPFFSHNEDFDFLTKLIKQKRFVTKASSIQSGVGEATQQLVKQGGQAFNIGVAMIGDTLTGQFDYPVSRMEAAKMPEGFEGIKSAYEAGYKGDDYVTFTDLYPGTKDFLDKHPNMKLVADFAFEGLVDATNLLALGGTMKAANLLENSLLKAGVKSSIAKGAKFTFMAKAGEMEAEFGGLVRTEKIDLPYAQKIQERKFQKIAGAVFGSLGFAGGELWKNKGKIAEKFAKKPEKVPEIPEIMPKVQKPTKPTTEQLQGRAEKIKSELTKRKPTRPTAEQLKDRAEKIKSELKKREPTKKEAVTVFTDTLRARKKELSKDIKRFVPKKKVSPMKKKIPKFVQRIEEVGDIPRAKTDKPHGVYTTPANVKSPHQLGGNKYYWETNPNAKILELELGVFESNRGSIVGESSGVAAARKLVGDEEVLRMMRDYLPDLKKEIADKYGIETHRYYDQHELVEAVAGIEVRKQGYDAIWAPNRQMPEFSEFVAITDKAFKPIKRQDIVAPKFGKPKIPKKESTTFKPSKKLERKYKLPEDVKRKVDVKTKKETFELPESIERLETIKSDMEVKKEKGFRINLQLFSEVEKKIDYLKGRKKLKPEAERLEELPIRERIATDTKKRKVKKPIFEKIKDFKKTLNDAKLRAQYEGVDELVYSKEIERKITGVNPEKIDAEQSFYKAQRLEAGAPGGASERLRVEFLPIIRKMEKAIKADKRKVINGRPQLDMQEIRSYIVAKHAKDINALGRESGFSNARIKEVLDRYENNPVMKEIQQDLVNYNRRMLDDLVEVGYISKEDAIKFKKQHPNYVSFMRDRSALEKSDDPFAKVIKESFSDSQEAIKKYIGSELDVNDPLANTLKNTYLIQQSIARQRTQNNFADLAWKDREGKYIKRLKKGESAKDKNVVKIKQNGRDVEYVVASPEVASMMSSFGRKTSNMVIDVMQGATRILRTGAVSNVEFALRNMFRDVASAYVFSKSGFLPTDFVSGAFSYMKTRIGMSDKAFTDFFMQGGGMSGQFTGDRIAYNKRIKEFFKKKPTEQVIHVVNPKTWLRGLQAISEFTEVSTKLGEFKRAIKTGVSKQEAAYRARDLMDFAKGGRTVKSMNRFVAFLNANVLGKDKLVRSLTDKEEVVGVVGRITKILVLPTVGLFANNYFFANQEQKRQIFDAPEWERNTYWMMAVPGTNTVLKFPKPFDLAAIPNVTERAMQYFSKEDPKAFEGYWKAQGDQLVDIPLMVAGLLPFMEGYSGYTFFTNRRTIPEREKYLSSSEQYDINTSEMAKFIASIARKNPYVGEEAKGGLTNFGSPRIVDQFIYGHTAGLGKTVNNFIDLFAGDKKKPAKTLEQQPIVKAFVKKPISSGKGVEKVYSDYNTMLTEKTTAEHTGKPFKNYEKYYHAKETAEAISSISKQIRDIRKAPDIAPKEKTRQIVELTKERNKIGQDYRYGRIDPVEKKLFEISGKAEDSGALLSTPQQETKTRKFKDSKAYLEFMKEFKEKTYKAYKSEYIKAKFNSLSPSEQVDSLKKKQNDIKKELFENYEKQGKLKIDKETAKKKKTVKPAKIEIGKTGTKIKIPKIKTR